MNKEYIKINSIPAIVWGAKSDKVWLCVHGKMSSKEAFAELAGIAEEKGYQTLSFDLPQHGDRVNEPDRCDIWNGIRDLAIIGDYAFDNWQEVNLFGCSLGAFFSLHAYSGRSFGRCLFQSPIIDMEYLVRQMMLWFGITEERLAKEKEIDTPVDLLSWDYFRYVLSHPIEKWGDAHILFGGRDDLQNREIMEKFVERFGGSLTVSIDSRHPFMEERDFPIVTAWLEDNI